MAAIACGAWAYELLASFAFSIFTPERALVSTDYILRQADGGNRIGGGYGIVYNAGMTKLLEKGIEAVRGLPADRQDMAGELLLSLAKNGTQYSLTAEQIADVKLAMAEADRGEFATDSEMAETWKKFGR